MAARGARNSARLAAVVVAGALLAFQVVRTAAVADRESRPALAGALWPAHPAILAEHSLLAIAKAAARGRGVPHTTRADIRRIAERAPLSPDPFVIEGAIAETEGRERDAERLLLAARDRNPRSRSARYLLADRYLRTGRVNDALIEMQALVSLQPRGAGAFVPALVAYAAAPGAIAQLRAFFAKYPRVEASVLSALATVGGNADLVLALATDNRKPDPDWRGTIVQALVNDGQYAKAQATWARLGRVRPGHGLFNPGFADFDAPGPFDWQFPAGSDGVAEPDGKGGLEVLYYGRARSVLASQLLLLAPGRYRLSMALDGSGAENALHWVLRCAKDQTPLADIPLRSRNWTGSFAVPEGCEAQWLELQGIPSEAPATTELTIRGLRLDPEAGT